MGKAKYKMHIAILTLHKQKINMSNYYNSQDLGLAKGLIECGNQVIVYKSISKKEYKSIELIREIEGINVEYLPSIHFGNHSFLDTNRMDKGVDCLICFSDNQIFFPRIYKWCKKLRIPLYPYIGTISSENSSFTKQKIMEFLNSSNINIYRKLICFAKTPALDEELKSKGIRKTFICPVGLDESKLNTRISVDELTQIRMKMGILESTQIILFVGRLVPVKKPLELLELLKNIIAVNNSFHLLMIGKGPFESEVLSKIEQLKISEHITFIREVKNADMWKYYSISNYFVNLSREEIYGMAILEAMYYKCKVIALKAPGPSFIIETGKTGYLFDDIQEIIEFLFNDNNSYEQIENNAHDDIIKRFTWNYSAKIIEKEVKNISQITK